MLDVFVGEKCDAPPAPEPRALFLLDASLAVDDSSDSDMAESLSS